MSVQLFGECVSRLVCVRMGVYVNIWGGCRCYGGELDGYLGELG